MNESTAVLRPETHALDALIQSVVAKVEASADAEASDRMVFLGNRHAALPTAVIADRVLEPVDKVVWMVISLAARETGADAAFPGYETIGKLANIASRSTIARAIAILRATRWLTLCARVRRASGTFQGNVYALHDEPLPLADAVHLDAEYMMFLDRATDHAHARVRAVARGVLDSIDDDVQAGQAVCQRENPVERRVLSTVPTQDGYPRRFFAFTPRVVRRLYANLHNENLSPADHDQNSNAVSSQVRNSNPGSSKDISTTTTTDTPSNFDIDGKDGQPLVYPARLSDNHRVIAARYLRELAPAQRQPVLDELEGRLRAEHKGMRPVYDAIRFLHALCKGVKQGSFQPNLGLGVRDGRRQIRHTADRNAPAHSAPVRRETDAQRAHRNAAGRVQIATMRKVLGLRSPAHSENVDSDS